MILDDETLMAYADNELDPQQIARVERALADDPDAQQRLRIFQQSTALLAGAFDKPLHQPPPERLLKTIRDHGSATVTAPKTPNPNETASAVIDFNSKRLSTANELAKPRVSNRAPLALAASVALLMGLGAGYLTAMLNTSSSSVGLTQLDASLNKTLETTVSGTTQTFSSAADLSRTITPLVTFTDEGGRYCREFEQTLGNHSSVGVACRSQTQADWQIEALMTRRLVTPTLPDTDTSQYAPAAGQDIAPFDAVIDALIGTESSAAPLTPAEEQRLLELGWND